MNIDNLLTVLISLGFPLIHCIPYVVPTGNVAFLKTAFRIDTGAEANNIVDGWIGSGHACTTVDTGDTDLAASVTVDLGGWYSVDEIVVYNTHNSAGL